MMKCGIQNCTQGDSRFLWHCQGTCGRSFHAACIGVQRNNEELLRSFMLPLCHDCQEQFTTELNLKALTSSLRQIDSSIGKTLESNHKLISNYSSLSASQVYLDEAVDSIEKSLQNFSSRITNLEATYKNNAAEIKSTLESFGDTPPVEIIESTAKSAAFAAVAEMTTAAATIAADTADSQLTQIISAMKDGLCDSHSTLMDEVKVHFDEMHKSLLASQLDKNSPTSCNCGNLADEIAGLNSSSPQPSITDEAITGWRMIGSIRRWKSDWRDYDERKRRRNQQEHNAQKARRKRRIIKTQYKNINKTQYKNIKKTEKKNCSTNNNYNYSYNDYNNNSKNNNKNNKNNNCNYSNNINNKYNNINNISKTHYISSSNPNVTFKESNHSMTGNLLRSLYNGKQLQHLMSLPQLPASSSKRKKKANGFNLPSDKELLEAAKATFSGNSKNRIDFQKGETLNPYGNATTKTSTTAPISTVAASPPYAALSGSSMCAVHSSARCAGCALMATWLPSHPDFPSRNPDFEQNF